MTTRGNGRGPSAVALLALLGILPGTAGAHPHAWIDLTVEVLFEDGKVGGLRETWSFDEYYSAFAMEGLGRPNQKRPSQQDLDAILHENMSNLRKHLYFTRVERREGKVSLSTATEMETHLDGKRLVMSFVVPFTMPVPVTAEGFDYRIFDPTYYVEMRHARKTDAVRLIGAPGGCSHRLEPPAPDEDTVNLAAALDRMQTAGDGLGALFAERVTVRCEPVR